MFPSSAVLRARDDLLARAFLFLRKFKPTRERVSIGEYNDHVEREHLARYQFALRFCEAKTVADIACGTGYGSDLLRRVAKNVESFDKEDLCGNRLIDLEKDCWSGTYDVIVSYETIEHLVNPEFFLDNARRTTKALIVSTPIGEFRGYNPHHKQVWTFPEFKALVERYFECNYYFQQEAEILDVASDPVRFVIAVGTPKF
jgi:2-polyprenyl-3-methyl-5-hydroxy-6-metoxy-1,4-benzoquinol methylase